MTTFTRKLPQLAAAATLLATAGCATMQSSSEPGLKTSPKFAGSTVTVDVASMPSDGWLVIHATKDGKPVVPASIGHTAVKAGENRDVTVTLDMPTRPGDVVIAMLHYDTGAIGSYEFGPGSVAEDKPIAVGGKPVVAPIKIQ